MLEGYRPIDFGNTFLSPNQTGQMRNRVGLSQGAMDILSNSKWNKTPISTLLAQGLNSKGEAPKRQQTLWGRVVDLLSTPAYAVSNAADDALAGHQSDDNDSVLSDASQILGGIVTGAGRGIGTGFRGAFAPSEIAADPQDKQYLDEFLVRLDTHMSAEDAVKPENREKLRQALIDKKINQFVSDDDLTNRYFYNYDTGNVEVGDEQIEEYFKEMGLAGLGASIVADPINFISAGAKVANLTKGAKGTAEVPGDITKIQNSNNIYDGFKPVDPRAIRNFEDYLNPGNPLLEGTSQLDTIKNASIKVPEWFNFPKTADGVNLREGTTVTRVPVDNINVTDPLDEIINAGSPGEVIQATRQTKPNSNIFPPPRVPDEQARIARSLSSQPAITKLTGDLLRRASTGGQWNYNIANRLSTKYPGVQFTNTESLVDRLYKLPDFQRRLKIPAERTKIMDAFSRVLRADVEAMKVPPPVDRAFQIIRNTNDNPMLLGELVAGAKPKPIIPSKNPTRDLAIVQDVVKRFEPQLNLTEIPSGIKNASTYRAAMQAHGVYTGPKQVNVWNALTSTPKYLLNVKTPKRFEKALNLLKAVEERFIAAGHIPMSSTPKAGGSVPLRLSQILEAIGPTAAAMDPTLFTKILRGDETALSKLTPEVLQRIEEIKAGEAIVDSQKMIKGIDTASKSIEDLIKGPLPAGQMEEIVTIGSRVADDIAQAAGASPVAGKTAERIVKQEFIPRVPGDGFPVTNTTALISHPDVSANLIKKYGSAPTVTNQIHKVMGGPSPRKLGKLVGAESKATEWLGARFNSAYRNADMRPVYLKNAAFAKSTVARRAEYLNELAKRYPSKDVDLWNDALKGAQGLLDPVPGSQAAQLAKEIDTVMQNLFGSSGLTKQVMIDNAVATRAQLFMHELNANLKRFGLGEYQFKKGPKSTKAKPNPYHDGINWLNSWKSWDIKNPLEFMFKIQNVVEHTVREKVMFDEIAARFGAVERGGEFIHKANHPRLAGTYFGPEAAKQVNQFIKNLKEAGHTSSKQMQMFDKAVSKWKAAVTIYVPSHHIRNMIGDLYFNWMAGVNSTRPYGSALKVMQAQKGRYDGLQGIEELISPDAIEKAMRGASSTPLGKQTALTMRNGQNVTNDMVYVSAFQNGILPTTRVLEDIPDDAITMMDKFRPLGGRGQKAAHQLSEGRDHYVRLAHYIDALKKSSKPFEQAVEEASAVVRKWHPDGMDLTKFERNVMRRMFPFYSWTRKAYPLIIESLVATPGKAMAYPKGMYFLQEMMGIDHGPMSDPFPVDQLFPDWIREKGIGPMFTPDSSFTGALGGAPGYSVVNPSNPLMDTVAQSNNPGKMALGMLNPAARIPLEVAMGTEAQTGAPIDQDYFVKQVPGLSHVGRATGEFGVSDTQKDASQWVNWQNILNMLTAAGAQNTGPYRKSAEFDLRDYLKSLKE